SAAAAAVWCRSAPPAAWAWWRSSSAERLGGGNAAVPGALRGRSWLLGKARHPVLVAFLHHRQVVQLLAHVTAWQVGHRLATAGVQRVGVGQPGAGIVTGLRETLPHFLPRIGPGALGDCAVQIAFRLWPLLLLATDPRQCQQQRRAGGVGLQPAFAILAPPLQLPDRQTPVQ